MINKILRSRFCIIEFIELIGEKKYDKMLNKASHLIFFLNSFNEFSDTCALI